MTQIKISSLPILLADSHPEATTEKVHSDSLSLLGEGWGEGLEVSDCATMPSSPALLPKGEGGNQTNLYVTVLHSFIELLKLTVVLIRFICVNLWLISSEDSFALLHESRDAFDEIG
jgi:hypothetical protein